MPYFETSKQLRIHYAVYGEEGRPPLVLLHGLGSCTRIWEPQIDDLSRYCRVYSFDYPGHGLSEVKGPYSYEAFADILHEFMDGMKIESAHLLALSVGCNVALYFAGLQPDRVRSLILQGPSGGHWPLWHPLGWYKAILLTLYLMVLLVLLFLLGKNKVVHLINRIGPQTHGYYPLLDSVEREFHPICYAPLAYRNASPPYIGKLDKVRAPVLIIRGQDDAFPRRYYRDIQKNLKQVSLMIEISHARHVVAIEQPALFNQAVLDFLRHTEEPPIGGETATP